MATKPSENRTTFTPSRRIRWATQRVTGLGAQAKRHGIMSRIHKGTGANEKKRESGGSESVNGSHLGGLQESPSDGEQAEEESGQRRLFFNLPLPDDAKDDEGLPVQYFARNKIRTARYTPLSFVPKNLWYQFHNIANIYFAFVVILAIFPVFGAVNPGLGSVPILFILFVTAVKDGIEDWRRTMLDNELNKSPVHRLVDWNNVNVSEDNVSLWRRIKKATSRGIKYLVNLWKTRKDRKSSGGKTYAERALDESRHSIETRRSNRTSIATTRNSFHSAAERHSDDIQMTAVPSSLRTDGFEDQPLTGIDGKRQSGPKSIPFHGDIINHTKQIPGKSRFKKDVWKNVQVGDFVRIYNNDQIPADIAVLSTSDPEGACYVETKNLDGETNLKLRNALQCGMKATHARDCERAEFTVVSEAPHANLYSYSGAIHWKQHNVQCPEQPGTDMSEPISINNLLLRGCSLRNTKWVIGVVLFAGSETKIMINSGITPSKRSRITRELNWNVIYNFIILLVMCIVSGVAQGVNWGKGNNSLSFFEIPFGSGQPPALSGFITFWTAVIQFQNLVPISLFISLEIIKTAQAYFIFSDIYMYYERFDYPCTPKTWNISDDLGQIEYIFSDKTGTLTQNVMEFKKCTVNGVPYGEAYTEAQAGMQKRAGVENVEEEGAKARKEIAQYRVKMLEDLRKIHDNPYLHDEDLTFIAPDYVADMNGGSGDEQKVATQHFMLALALCHTVVTEKTPGDPPKLEFKAQSPDEAALVATARDCGFTFLGKASHDDVLLNVLGEERQYKILQTLEFNSARKRMSAVVRMPDSRIILFCKGADSIIYSRLRKGEQRELRDSTAEHLEMFAREGLRTLCIAQRVIGEEEYQVWNKQHAIAASAVQDREEKIEAVSDLIERDLTLLGGTAIEDRLQDGVPDTISLLGDGGIKLWVLTGDKVETAINIGFSCNLLNNDMELIVFKPKEETPESAEAELDLHLGKFNMTGSDKELAEARKNHEPPGPGHAIVIDGDGLKLLLDEDRIRQKFLLLCKQCKSVLCCRVSPSQKAAVVQMVKTGLDVMTLSIGDGANDVAMIQEADIGVGIAGEEGRQAVMSSDYAIGQFRFLQRLVLVHGRWSYRRIGETVANFFYKNMVWTFVIFWYQLYNNFDGSYFFDYTYILLYNLAFTALPSIFIGILDQDVSDRVSLAVPQLYRRGIERKEWTSTKFWVYMFDGIYQSLVCFYMAYLLFIPATFVTSNGLDLADRERMGVYVACATVVVVNFYILLNTYRWDWLMLLLVTVSVLLIWFWTGVYTVGTSASIEFYKAAPQVYGQLSFWTLSLLLVVLCLLPRFTAKSFQKIFMPRDVDIIRERVRQGCYRDLDNVDPTVAPMGKPPSEGSSDLSHPEQGTPKARLPGDDDDRRPIYPPSIAHTATTANPRSQNGSDGTDYTGHRPSFDAPLRPSYDRPRPSFDRMRQSMDRIRPSFEASNDFTSAALLTRMESSHSQRMAQQQRLIHGSSCLR